jgi:hypothetical protein
MSPITQLLSLAQTTKSTSAWVLKYAWSCIYCPTHQLYICCFLTVDIVLFLSHPSIPLTSNNYILSTSYLLFLLSSTPNVMQFPSLTQTKKSSSAWKLKYAWQCIYWWSTTTNLFLLIRTFRDLHG